MVAWTELSWEAFATLVTGMAAVGGAIFVSQRQLRISENQNEILAQQNRLSELALRSDLFDRRMDVYDGVRAYIAHIVTHAAPPDRELETRFLTASAAARFLFSADVEQNVDEIWKRANEFRALHRTMRHLFDREGHYGEGNPERESDHLKWFCERLTSLPEMFGDEIKLA